MFRFTIRDLLWLMVVVGLAVCWWLDRSRLAERVAYDDRIFSSMKLLDYVNPNWREVTARYIKENDLPAAEK